MPLTHYAIVHKLGAVVNETIPVRRFVTAQTIARAMVKEFGGEVTIDSPAGARMRRYWRDAEGIVHVERAPGAPDEEGDA